MIDALVFSATVPAVLFPVLYALRSNWRATLPGRALMQLAVSMASVLVLISLTTVLGDYYPGRMYARIAVYGWLVASLWRQVYVLVRLQNEQHGGIRRARDRVLDDELKGTSK